MNQTINDTERRGFEHNGGAIAATIAKISNTVPRVKDEYTGSDGLLHCSVCHRATQCKIELFGEMRVVPCICDCRVKEIEAEKEMKRREENDSRRRVCFQDCREAFHWTFANDDNANARITAAMMRYAENYEDFRKDGKGLLLWGSVGTGKSYHAACVANYLIDRGKSAYMANFEQIAMRLMDAKFGEKTQELEKIVNYDFLVFDDLGIEKQSDNMQSQVFNVIDGRYRTGKPFIVTTNLHIEEIKKPSDIKYARIYDRILERCIPVEVSGASRRRHEAGATYKDYMSKLGL